MKEHELKPDEPAVEVTSRTLFRRPRVRIGAAVAVAVAGGLAAWAIVGSEGTGSSPTSSAASATTAKPIGPVGLSGKGLRTLTASIDQPIYWSGSQTGYVYELTRTTSGKVFVRYLPPGVKVGTTRASYLIVATYPFREPYQALEHLNSGRKLVIPHGGVAIVDGHDPKSVHMAFPGVNYQIEIYDPSPARALRVARSGAVRPVTPHS